MIITGYYKILPYRNLFFTECYESWDQDMAAQYLADCLKTISKYYSGKSWGLLTDLSKWEPNTPQTGEFWKETFKKELHFPTHAAYIVGISEFKQWSVDRFMRVNRNIQVSFFEYLSDGIEWLRDNGYQAADPLWDQSENLR